MFVKNFSAAFLAGKTIPKLFTLSSILDNAKITCILVAIFSFKINELRPIMSKGVKKGAFL